MKTVYKPMSLPMKLVLWFVVANAYAGAGSLILFRTNTQSTFFWNIRPPINAAMFGVLYLAAGSIVIQDGQLSDSWHLARQPFMLETSLPGVFAVGDVRSGSIKRVASAVGEGSVVIHFVHQYLQAQGIRVGIRPSATARPR